MNRLAVAALVCAGAGPVSLGITAIPAIALGQLARRRIRRTGERGFAAATAAVVLGCLMMLIAAVVITGLVLWDILGTLPLPLGVAGHEGSTVIVGLNGLRLLRRSVWTRAGSGTGG